jgi:hypothetical protein
MKSIITLSLFFSFLLNCFETRAQVAKTQVVMAGAIANPDGTITIYWPQESYSGSWQIYRRSDLNNEDWGSAPVGTAAGNAASWKDASAKAGFAYEYLVAKVNASNQTDALGYVWAGNRYEEQPGNGGIILLIDSNYRLPLNNEINRLNQQLQSEGWSTSMLYAGRKEKPAAVRSRIQAEYQRRGGKVSTLYIIGHVPVPYSGDYSSSFIPPPDGHVEGSGNHTGAWPADLYYGELDGEWFDSEVTRTTGSSPRLHNIPGDGKMDQTKVPGAVDLEVGRVDLFDMTSFSKNDTLLVRKYLNRNHLWRTGQLRSVNRALIDNNFTGLNLASTGYHNFATFFRTDSIFDNRDYFTAQKSGAYLWSYGCGAGSYTSCSGIGNTNNFAADSLRNIFTILAGSYFGDWDVNNNFLRAPLANSALACFWGGIPKWYVHHMALGKHIGFGTRISQNNSSFYFSGNFNYSQQGIHIALMGDPTLRMAYVPGPSNLQAQSISNRVKLTWNRAKGAVDGYAVYRYDSASNGYFRVNKGYLISDTVYYDSTNYLKGRNLYTVRALRLETTNSGTWWNASGGPYAAVSHTNANSNFSAAALGVRAYPNPGNGLVQLALSETVRQASIRVFDMNGRLMLSQQFDAAAQTLEADLSALRQGVYLIQVEASGYRSSSCSYVKLP